MVKIDENKRMICRDKTPQYFYKIMHPSLSTKHLRIPPGFMKHIIVKEDCGRAVLKGPNGGHWNIKLCKANDGTYIQDGWKDFLRDHLLGNHEFLVFRYDGNMHFTVKIFEKTGCEREDLFDMKKQGKTQKKVASSSCNKQGRLLLELHKKDPVLCLSTSRRQLKTDEEKAKVWNAAMSFTSSLPYFLRRLNKSSVRQSFVLKIPSGFAKEHLPRYKKQIVISIPKGKSWIVNFIPSKSYSFSGGWMAFVRDNKLEEGDVCAFKLIRELELSVHFFRSVMQVSFTSHEQA